MQTPRPIFDLTSQPWIPCVLRDSNTLVELSLRDALVRAHEIVEISDASPLVGGSLYRFLVAVVHRVYGPPDVDAWGELWTAGRFDPAPLDTYLANYRDRFDLFHPQHPFYQTPDLPEPYAVPISKLAQIGLGTTAGNNATLFSHDSDDSPRPLRPAVAARLLVANQTFAVGGLISRKPGEPPSAKASPLFTSALIINVGQSLFETLLLNAVLVNGARGEPFEFDPAEDRPAWESEPPARGERRPQGYLDFLTWQFRRIRLLPDSEGLVARAIIMDGWSLPDDLDVSARETMVAYRRPPKGASGIPAWQPIAFEPERALWRDGTALLRWSRGPRNEGGIRAPRVLRWVAELTTQHGVLPADRFVALAAYGICANRSKLEFWRHERLPLPLAYFHAPEVAVVLADEVALAEEVERVLESAVYHLCRHTLFRNQPEDRRRVRTLSDALQWRLEYWSQLDEPALALIVDLPRDENGARTRWEHELRRSAQDAFEGSVLALATSIAGMRSAALVRPWFRSKLAGVVKPSSSGSEEAPKEEAM